MKNGKIPVERFVEGSKNFYIRYAAKDYTFASDYVPKGVYPFDFGFAECLEVSLLWKGIIFRIEDVETAPKAMIDYSFF